MTMVSNMNVDHERGLTTSQFQGPELLPTAFGLLGNGNLFRRPPMFAEYPPTIHTVECVLFHADQETLRVGVDGEYYVFRSVAPDYGDGRLRSWFHPSSPIPDGHLAFQNELCSHVQIGDQLVCFRRLPVDRFCDLRLPYSSQFLVHRTLHGDVYNFGIIAVACEFDMDFGSSYFVDHLSLASHTALPFSFTHARYKHYMEPLYRINVPHNVRVLQTWENYCNSGWGFPAGRIYPPIVHIRRRFISRGKASYHVQPLRKISFPFAYDLLVLVVSFLHPDEWFRSFVLGDAWGPCFSFAPHEVSYETVSRLGWQAEIAHDSPHLSALCSGWQRALLDDRSIDQDLDGFPPPTFWEDSWYDPLGAALDLLSHGDVEANPGPSTPTAAAKGKSVVFLTASCCCCGAACVDDRPRLCSQCRPRVNELFMRQLRYISAGTAKCPSRDRKSVV